MASISNFENKIREMVSMHMEPLYIIKSFLDENQKKIFSFYYMDCDLTELKDRIAASKVNLGYEVFSPEWENLIMLTVNKINEIINVITFIEVKNSGQQAEVKTPKYTRNQLNEMIGGNAQVRKLREMIEHDF